MSEAAPAEACPEAAEILRVAGWKPHDEWGVYTHTTLVMGFQPDGQSFHVKNWARDVHGPDYPDDPVGAALWLVAKFPRPVNPLQSEATLEPVAIESEPAPSPEPDMAQPININVAPVFNVGGSHSESGATQSASDKPDGWLGSDIVDAESEETESRAHEDVRPDDRNSDDPAPIWAGDNAPEDQAGEGGLLGERAEAAPASAPIDADFGELGSDELAEPPALDAPDLEEALAQEEASGPVTYQGSDLDSLIREKLGRVSQIARDLKATLQEGWTLEEFAYLQNQIIRMDRGEAPDDEAARERFVFISERSRAMGAVNLIRDGKEDALTEIGARRAYAEAQAFDPEAGW